MPFYRMQMWAVSWVLNSHKNKITENKIKFAAILKNLEVLMKKCVCITQSATDFWGYDSS